MKEMIELTDKDLKTATINPLNILKDLKDNVDTMMREMQDIKKNQIWILEMKMITLEKQIYRWD